METNTPSTIKLDDLLNSLDHTGRYDHLRIFLTKEKKLPFERDFLLVTKLGFQKVVLRDIDFDEQTGSICLVLQECESGLFKTLNLDIMDRSFRCILIDYRDIKNMVFEESMSKGMDDNELLDFEFEKND